MTFPEALARLGTYRREGLKVYDAPNPVRTAVLIMNMQNAWLAPGAPFRLFREGDADIVVRINAAAARWRAKGALVVWLRTTTGAPGTPTYWSTYFDHFVGPAKREAAVAALQVGSEAHELSPLAAVAPGDIVMDKSRFDAFARTALDETLRARAIDAVVVAGTATNICCESTIREAMSRDYRTFMPYDLVCAPTEDGHLAGLRNVLQAFADVRASDEVVG